MSMLDLSALDLENAPEPVVMESGSECKLRIMDVTTGKDKNDTDFVLPRFEVADEPLAKDFTKFLGLTKDGMDEKRKVRNLHALKVFCQAFGIDMMRAYEPEDDWPGEEGWAILGVEDSEEYGERNYVKKFIVPK